MKKLLVLLTGFFIIFNSNAQTYVSGGIYSNETWTTAGSPYILSDTVVVFGGVTLTIQPGVIVKFRNNALLEDRGNLFAIGTPIDSIVFTSDSSSPFAGIYHGIEFDFGDTMDFKYCRFSYAYQAIANGNNPISHCLFASDYYGTFDFYGPFDSCSFKYNYTGIDNIYSNPKILDCEFEHNSNYAIWGGSLIYNCMFSYNKNCGGGDTVAYCIFTYNDTAVYLGNVIIYNSVTNNSLGIIGGNYTVIRSNYIVDNFVGMEPSYNDSISCNTICNNSYYNIVYEAATSNTTIRDNYWCLTDSAQIQATIYDGYQNINDGLIFFTPFDTVACANVSTTVNELPATSDAIKLFPNPNNGSFSLSIRNHELEINNVEIYNMLGQVVYKSSITQSMSQIKLNNATSGVYLYRIISEKGNLVGTGKFVVE